MDAGGLLERLAPPPGDAGQVRAAADAWRSAADRLDDLTDRARHQVATLAGSWRGPARDGFATTWQALAPGLVEGSGQVRAAADALDRAAGALEQAHARYWQVMAGAGAAVAVGLLLTPLTLGASDVVADGVAAGEVAVLLGSLAEALGVEASVLAGVTAAAARLLTTFVVQAGAAAAADAAGGAAFFPDHDPRRHLDLRADVGTALAGAAAAPWRAVLAGGAARLIPGVEAAGGVAAGIALDGAAFGLGDASVQVVLDGRVDPGVVAFAALGATAGSALGRAVTGTGPARALSASQAAATPASALLSPRLRAILARSTEVPAGRSFFDPRRDPWLAATVRLVPAERGTAVVFLHGATTTVYASGSALDAPELAALVRADPRLAGRPVRLFACDTGRLDDGFAQRLARELAVEVHAPTQLAWLGPHGEMYTTSGRLVDDLWVQTVPHDGRWRTFHPE